MIKEMTQEQFEKLKPFENFLEQSQHDFLVNQPMSRKEIVFGINKEIFGAVTGSINCPTCVLREYKRLAEVYFKYKEEHTVENIEQYLDVTHVGDPEKNQEEIDKLVQEKIDEETILSTHSVTSETISDTKTIKPSSSKKTVSKQTKTIKK